MEAMADRRFLLSAWPWRGLAYLLSTGLSGLLALSVLATMVVVGGLLSTVLIGVPIFAAIAFAGIPAAAVERWRLGLIDAEPVEDPHRKPDRPGVYGWVVTRVRERATWRELAYTLLLALLLWPLDLAVIVLLVGVPLALVTSPLSVLVGGGSRAVLPGVVVSTPAQALVAVPAGLLLLLGAGYAVPALATVQAGLARGLLAPREDELRARLAQVTLSRARLVRAFEAERRRIERDLHDGAQQRLVAVSMRLGLALLDLPGGPSRDLVAQAQEQAKLALTELRELIHGIHPRILTQYGLPAAVQDAADRSPVPVDVRLDLPARPPAEVEATGYFAVCEALANVAKHSQAGRAWVTGRLSGDTLVLEIGDDGVGGADPESGGGLAGLTDRVAVVGGSIGLSSPAGGPTLVRVELPCPNPEHRSAS